LIAIIIAQHIERFYFGGVNKHHLAGKCKRDVAPARYITARKSKLLVGAETMDDLDSQTSASDMLSHRMENGLAIGYTSPNNFRRIDDDNASFASRSVFEGIHRQVSFESSVQGSLVSDKSSSPISVRPQLNTRPTSRFRDGLSESTMMMEWTCVTCAMINREPRHPQVDPLILSQSVGELYTRTFAVIKPRRVIPQCRNCFTDADYVPTKAVAHLFKHYPERYSAFSNYPLKVEVSPGLSRTSILRPLRALYSICFGLHDDVDSLLLHSDWRMHKYLPSKFVDIQRPAKLEDELYCRGEVIESKHQKLDWVRARIVQARINHTYDIM
jgi:hypothetical protein